MIRSLSGIVLSIDEDMIILEVSGFGLEVYASGSLLSSAVIGERLSCFAYLQVSDAGMAMFGFSDETERALFLEIMQVKTMGGKLSIALLRHLDANTIVSAITASDPSGISVPGLGPKRAERICFELKTKIEKKFVQLSSSGAGVRRTGSIDSEVISGLMGLSFSQNEALHAVSQCRVEDAEREWNAEDLMMSALGKLQRR
jgi:Holliday junction DNA helicase RuvA